MKFKDLEAGCVAAAVVFTLLWPAVCLIAYALSLIK